MYAALHVFATIVVLPYVVLAIGFVILGHSISSGSLLSFFDTLLAPHGIYVFEHRDGVHTRSVAAHARPRNCLEEDSCKGCGSCCRCCRHS